MRLLPFLALCLLGACGDTTTAKTRPLDNGSFAPGLIAVAPHLEDALQRASRASAAIRMPYDFDANGLPITAPDGTPLVASCGATFIDAHHAITAGHCVTAQAPAPADRPIEVDFFDVAESVPWQKTTTLTGQFPSYDHPRLTEADGYVVHALTCHLVASCYGSPIDPAVSTHCPVETMPTGGADVALLRCDDDLPAGHGPIGIASRPLALGEPVSYFWFHELYFEREDADAATILDFDDHYLQFDGHPADNFHYHGWNSNQLLPLVPTPFVVDGKTVPQSVLALDEQYVTSDLFACHGSSGSGAIRLDAATGEYELIGPAAGLAQESNLLCPTGFGAGVPNTLFSTPAQVRAIAALR